MIWDKSMFTCIILSTQKYKSLFKLHAFWQYKKGIIHSVSYGHLLLHIHFTSWSWVMASMFFGEFLDVNDISRTLLEMISLRECMNCRGLLSSLFPIHLLMIYVQEVHLDKNLLRIVIQWLLNPSRPFSELIQ